MIHVSYDSAVIKSAYDGRLLQSGIPVFSAIIGILIQIFMILSDPCKPVRVFAFFKICQATHDHENCIITFTPSDMIPPEIDDILCLMTYIHML